MCHGHTHFTSDCPYCFHNKDTQTKIVGTRSSKSHEIPVFLKSMAAQEHLSYSFWVVYLIVLLHYWLKMNSYLNKFEHVYKCMSHGLDGYTSFELIRDFYIHVMYLDALSPFRMLQNWFCVVTSRQCGEDSYFWFGLIFLLKMTVSFKYNGRVHLYLGMVIYLWQDRDVAARSVEPKV